jgi:hypothetical protein
MLGAEVERGDRRPPGDAVGLEAVDLLVGDDDVVQLLVEAAAARQAEARPQRIDAGPARGELERRAGGDVALWQAAPGRLVLLKAVGELQEQRVGLAALLLLAIAAEDALQPVARPLHAGGDAAHLRVDVDEIDALLDRARHRDRLVAARLGRERGRCEKRRGAEDDAE